MKRIITTVLIAFAVLGSYAQKSSPVGIRMEIASAEDNNTEYSVFTYKDEDGTFGYYLSIGRLRNVLPLFDEDQMPYKLESIRETAIWLGSTSDEALAALDAFIDLYDEDLETAREFKGRASTGANKLGEPNITTCIVKKKPLGGKRLQFIFTSKSHSADTYVLKTIFKELRTEFKMDRKLHPKNHQ